MRSFLPLASAALIALSIPAHAADFPLDKLDLSSMVQDWGQPHADQSVDGHPLTLGGKVFDRGIGTHAGSEFDIALDGHATEFTATVGIDDETSGKGAVRFQILADGKTVSETKVLHGGDAPVGLAVPLAGVHTLTLLVTPAASGIDFDHADWANAVISLPDGAALPTTQFAQTNAPPRLNVPADDPRPAIHGPRIVGATPGHPFLFRIPATGQAPLTFDARNLPLGLHVDPSTGVISGSVKNAGTTTAVLVARGPRGAAKRPLTIVAGAHDLARTPPMGWNSWNVWAGNIDQNKVQAAADDFIRSGLAAHGYEYVNIDDTWEGSRTAAGGITSNAKFPDMAALAAYVHSKGLKIGLYSSPGPKTCAGYEASYQHERQDAQTYAKWGFDYLKYDWCSYGGVPHPDGLPGYKLPYQTMSTALNSVDRDIFFSLCQYGMGDVWTWGASVGGNCWRTTGDINDSWSSLHSIYEEQGAHAPYAGPGHWNDPDMLVVGRVGWGNPHPSHLTPNEQILHISLWSMFAAPLIVGCDLDRLDPFTLALLTNDEVIDIDQDPLGHAARRIDVTGPGEVYARPLFDGRIAVAFVNPRVTAQNVGVTWRDLGISGPRYVRDLWLHKDEGSHSDGYSVSVPAHGCVLVTLNSTATRGK